MKLKTFAIAVIIVMLSGCDKVNNITDEDLFTMINDVGTEYDLAFEPDNFGTPEGAILVIYSPEIPVSKRRGYHPNIPYTEIQVDDFTKLNIESSNSLLFSAVYNEISIFMYYGHPGNKNCDFYTINDDETILFKQYDITVPLGNVIEKDTETKGVRYVVFVPRWTTLSNSKTAIYDVYKDISDNFSSIMSEVSKHIVLN